MSDRPFELEAARLYRALLPGDPPPPLLRRFSQASARMNECETPADCDAYYGAIARVDDLEALEIACRYSRRLPLLSRKLHLMVYLAETLPQNQERFINDRSSFAAGCLVMVTGGLRTAVKLAKGLFLLRKVPRG